MSGFDVVVLWFSLDRWSGVVTPRSLVASKLSGLFTVCFKTAVHSSSLDMLHRYISYHIFATYVWYYVLRSSLLYCQFCFRPCVVSGFDVVVLWFSLDRWSGVVTPRSLVASKLSGLFTVCFKTAVHNRG